MSEKEAKRCTEVSARGNRFESQAVGAAAVAAGRSNEEDYEKDGGQFVRGSFHCFAEEQFSPNGIRALQFSGFRFSENLSFIKSQRGQAVVLKSKSLDQHPESQSPDSSGRLCGFSAH